MERKQIAVYNHWTGQVDWTSGLSETTCKLVPRHELEGFIMQEE